MTDDLNDFCITIAGGEFSLPSLAYGAEEEKHPKSAIPRMWAGITLLSQKVHTLSNAPGSPKGVPV